MLNEFFMFQCRHSDDDTDDDYTEDGADETALESYLTPLDDENCPIDEYMVFKDVLSSKTSP